MSTDNANETPNRTDRIARFHEVEMWLGDGLHLRIEPPRDDQPFFIAIASDIRLATLGMTEDEAVKGMFEVVNRLINDFVEHDTPLPHRESPVSDPDAASDRDEQ